MLQYLFNSISFCEKFLAFHPKFVYFLLPPQKNPGFGKYKIYQDLIKSSHE